MPLPLLLLVLSGAPLEARYLLSVEGTPWAELRVELREGRYHYQATHFLEEGARRLERTWHLDARGLVEGRQPEVLALLTPPGPGCREVLEERGATPERLCVDARRGATVQGRLGEVPFTARYVRGALETIELPGARWRRVTRGTRAVGGTPPSFTGGFVVQGAGGRLGLAPGLAGAHEVTVAPVGREGEVGRARCLTLARRWAAEHPHRVVVSGLLVEGGLAWPHAWGREGEHHLDPSRPATALPARYLVLPPGQAGRVYLELVDGSRAVRAR